MPEFPRAALEALRQPLEDGRLVIGRAAGRVDFPAEALLVGAMNPCPCGWRGVRDGDGRPRCACSPRDVARYGQRISGPLRDRFDLHLDVKPVPPATLVGSNGSPPEPAAAPDARARARRAQVERAARLGLTRASNARIPGRLLPQAVEPTPEAEAALVQAALRHGLTARAVHRVLRVARTAADLAGAGRVEVPHVEEALVWRGA
jgi:magnesium chelatase family protein